VVECTALEMRRGGNSTGGSNPSLSAIHMIFCRFYNVLLEWSGQTLQKTHHLDPDSLSATSARR
jgi:hypothetical protein